MLKNDLNDRLFTFAVRTLKFTRTLTDSVEYKVVKYQLVKSATSSGANYKESQAGSSRADFANKVRISLREMRETNYWLRILNEINEGNIINTEIEWLIDESKELKNISGSIAQKARKDET